MTLIAETKGNLRGKSSEESRNANFKGKEQMQRESLLRAGYLTRIMSHNVPTVGYMPMKRFLVISPIIFTIFGPITT
jgi:hypothetical protein